MRWVLFFAVAACTFTVAAVLFPRSPGNPVDPGTSPMRGAAAGDSPMRSAAAWRPDLSGRARVIDGDSMDVGGTRVRLHGLDAPEGKQSCLVGGQRWPCGQRAARALAELIDGRIVACEERDRDRGRVYAVCRRDALDVNAWLVAAGWAVAYRRYSENYVEDESEAKAARRGIWRGEFVMPWDWRQGKRLQRAATDSLAASPATERQSRRCDIKGNISHKSGARIYHMPSDRDYAGTRISVERGERWFCSEREARAAGWRRAGR